ncbi:hypothetical protein ElyMa_000281700 [Elysia marginata]|uniref:Uncharacterized protein n=1 Tax=Elysia marginata TaxID=1093978 RepID=A0AAV4F831_9GAST|nr:hypothetical protein ElyMa_000281700 [Elysia marginata]
MDDTVGTLSSQCMEGTVGILLSQCMGDTVGILLSQCMDGTVGILLSQCMDDTVGILLSQCIRKFLSSPPTVTGQYCWYTVEPVYQKVSVLFSDASGTVLLVYC